MFTRHFAKLRFCYKRNRHQHGDGLYLVAWLTTPPHLPTIWALYVAAFQTNIDKLMDIWIGKWQRDRNFSHDWAVPGINGRARPVFFSHILAGVRPTRVVGLRSRSYFCAGRANYFLWVRIVIGHCRLITTGNEQSCHSEAGIRTEECAIADACIICNTAASRHRHISDVVRMCLWIDQRPFPQQQPSFVIIICQRPLCASRDCLYSIKTAVLSICPILQRMP